MEPAELLGVLAQVAVTMAGFAGVVVVFGRRAVHEWSPVDKYRLSLLLATSILPLALCLIGLLLLSTDLAKPTIWCICSALAAASFLLNAAGIRTFSRFRPEEIAASGARSRLFYATSLVGFGTLLLQLYNIAALRAFWPFFTTIVLSILISSLQFALMTLARE